MATLTVATLLEDAQNGIRKLDTEERRRVVGWLMGTQPSITNAEMAEWFQVSERAIRLDKQVIKEKMAKELREDDVALIVADIIADFRRQIQDIEVSKKQAKLGSNTYLMHCQAIVDLRLKTTKMLQDLGFYPKNLGNMTEEHFIYQAVVNMKDGSVQTQQLNAQQVKQLEAENVNKPDEDTAVVMEAEYADSPEPVMG